MNNIDKKQKICDLIQDCPVQKTLNIIGGKWKIIIVWYLMDHTMRTSELQKAIPKITQKMLIQQLRELQEDGIITRKAYPVIPPKVEYSLSKKGLILKPIVELMEEVGKYI